jgi:hypothetical protein
VALAVAVVIALGPYRTSIQFVEGDQIVHVPSKCGPPIVNAFKNEPRNMIFGASAMAGVRGIYCRSEGRKRMMAATFVLAVAAVLRFTGRGYRRKPSNR